MKNRHQSLIRAIKTLVPKKTTLPILENVKLFNKVILFTDLEISGCVPFESGIEACISAKDFLRIIDSNADAEFEVQHIMKGKVSSTVVKSGAFTLTPDDFDAFPSFPDLKNTSTAHPFWGKDLEQMQLATDFVSRDKLRPAMMNVFWNQHICSTDGHRMFFVKPDEHPDRDVQIMPKTLALLKCWPGLVWSYQYTDAQNLVCFTDTGLFIVQRPCEEKYPNYLSVIPDDNNNTFSGDREDLIKAVKTAREYSSATTHQVRFNFNSLKKASTISAEDIDFGKQYNEEIKGKAKKDIEIGFNADYLLSILNVIKDEDITITMSTPTRAVIINEKFLLMPVRLNS